MSHCDSIQHKATWADGSIVPSGGFPFHELDGLEPMTDYDRAFADVGETLNKVMFYILAGKNPEECGLRAISIGSCLGLTEHRTTTALAESLGGSKQWLGKHLAKARKSLPLPGCFSAEQRARMSAGKTRGRKQSGSAHPSGTEPAMNRVSSPNNQSPSTLGGAI